MKYVFLCTFILSCAAANTDNLQRAENAVTVEKYRKELVDCKRKGKAARDYAVYERCAADVDKKYGLESVPDGGSND